ncbi:MAG: hypothetical protein KBF88_09265 [Polyangiaceae bacterium]|nr:hypothetical protein [Polyangiaceae bacterium]
MRTSISVNPLFSLALFSLLHCGGGAKPSATSGESAEITTASNAPVWSASMSKDEKVSFMRKHIVPRMEKAFQKGDPKATVSCKTCHGPNYKTPTEFLPHLVMSNGSLLAFTEKPAVAKFMAETIVPEMASAMGLKPYDPATHQGFGCGGCHAIDQK